MDPEQRLVNEAYAHIHKTGRPSVNPSGDCHYGGIGCAFRPAIKNLLPEMEGKGARCLLKNFSEHLHEWTQELDLSVAHDVQSCHDSNVDADNFLADFDDSLRELCKKYNLTFPGDTDEPT